MQLLHLTNFLDAAGWENVFAAPEAGPISDALAHNGTRVVLEAGLLTDPDHKKLRMLSRDFDVVVANTIACWPAVRAARSEGVPVIWYIHETFAGVRLMGQIPEIRPTLEMADLIVTPARETARIYEGLTRTPVKVVPYGIPDLGFDPKRIDPGAVRFLLLGTYEERKGQDICLDAIARVEAGLRSRGRFRFAGRPLDSEFFERAQRKAAAVGNVELLGGVDREEAGRLLRETDVLLVTSRDETMPIAIIEAMSLGRGVIAAEMGGIPEWIRDGLNGFLVPREDSTQLAAAISRCLAQPEILAEVSRCARRTYERHFRVESFAQRFGELLEKVAQKRIARRLRQRLPYSDWVRRFDTPDQWDRVALRRRIRGLRHQPLISILLPVYNPEHAFLRTAIDSVRAQDYLRWELCIADDASTDPEVRPLLEEIANREPRIRLMVRERNGHISACSNAALALATGEWCALLDHDDALAENALAWVALDLNAHPESGLLYSDEDKIDARGARSEPFFKTDFDPELFLAQNFINHLGVYRTALLREIGGFREGLEGSQDYDLALRCIERLRPDQIRHVPRILYHWRKAAGSLAALADAKPYAREAARRAIAEHLERRQIAGRVEACPENPESHRVIYEVTDPLPLVSVIIPMRDRIELVTACLRSLREATDYPALQIVVVDNGSVLAETLHSLGKLAARPGVVVLRDDREFNFSRLNNLAVPAARGDLLAFLNNDIKATEAGWLREMVSHAIRPQVGAVGARLWYPDGTLQHGGVVLGLGGVAGHAHHRIPRGHPGYFNQAWLQHNCSAVTAACLVMRRAVFEELGGFNEEHLAVNFNDIDLCLRARARGWQIIWTPYANLLHRESASRGHQATRGQKAQFLQEATYMQERWGAELWRDPFYNPNLTLKPPGYELADPPRLPEYEDGDEPRQNQRPRRLRLRAVEEL